MCAYLSIYLTFQFCCLTLICSSNTYFVMNWGKLTPLLHVTLFPVTFGCSGGRSLTVNQINTSWSFNHSKHFHQVMSPLYQDLWTISSVRASAQLEYSSVPHHCEMKRKTISFAFLEKRVLPKLSSKRSMIPAITEEAGWLEVSKRNYFSSLSLTCLMNCFPLTLICFLHA